MSTAILSALAEEQAGLLALLQEAQTTRHAGREFHTGMLHGQSVVLALARIGKVAAATTATALIEHFGAQRIVFTGVAGGLAAAVRIGDVVVGEHFAQHDMDARPLFPRYEVPLYGRTLFDADESLAAMILVATNEAMRVAGSHFDADNRVHAGLIVSGDQFVHGADAGAGLRERWPDALCVEMECAAVAQVCLDYERPFAAARTISDRADNSAAIDFTRFVNTVAGPFSTHLVDALLRRLARG